jgi:hypothetical protein
MAMKKTSGGDSEGFRSIEKQKISYEYEQEQPRSDLRDEKQRAGKSDLHTLVDRTAETFT